MGFDFIVIVPLLPSHCGFSFFFGCGVSFLVSSSVFLSMIIQQLIVIPVLSQEGVHPSHFHSLKPTPAVSERLLLLLFSPASTPGCAQNLVFALRRTMSCRRCWSADTTETLSFYHMLHCFIPKRNLTTRCTVASQREI